MKESTRIRVWVVSAGLVGMVIGALIAFFATLTLLSDSFVETAAHTAAGRLQHELDLLAELRRGDTAAAIARLETRIREGAMHLASVQPGLHGPTRESVDAVLARAARELAPPESGHP